MKKHAESTTEFEKFDATVGKLLSVPREELRRRESRWKKNRKRKKRTKA